MSRNQVLASSYSSSCNNSGNSSISDDDNGSIPADSQIMRNVMPHCNLMTTKSKEKKASPFERFTGDSNKTLKVSFKEPTSLPKIANRESAIPYASNPSAVD